MPYINLDFDNFSIKCLIDTGSTKSFIHPDIANKYFKDLIKIDPYLISTAHGTSREKYSINMPCPEKIFKLRNLRLKFHIFKFHKYFDCLLGMDNLSKLKVNINLEKREIILPHNTIKLEYKRTEEYNNHIVAKSPTEEIRQTDHLQSFEAGKNGNFFFQNLNNFNYEKCKFNLGKINISHCNDEEKVHLVNLLKSYQDIFHCENKPLTFSNSIKHRIKLKDETPIYTKTYRYPHIHKEEVKKQVQDMLRQGIIKPSKSPWSSPIWIVPKKADNSLKKKWRMVVDYRKLNEKTIDDKYPIPNITDVLDKLGRSQYFSTLDLASGFHQIQVHEKDTPKTAFTVENGHYEFIRMPFGLKNAPSTFQRIMDDILRDLLNESCLVYLDDIVIFSTSLQEHIIKLKSVFERLRKHNFKIQLDKCNFLQKETAYLGHVITPDGIKPNPDKIQAILAYKIPSTPKELKGFLGLLGYYRKFIKDFAKITKPLTNSLKKGNKIDINDVKYKKCFETCKQLLVNDPILQYPNFEEPFILTTDASNYAIGAILSQGKVIGSDLPISYASRTLNQHEINYSTIEKELLAVIWATKYFRPYLYGRKFKIVTDHKPLQWLFALKEPNSKLVRWRLKLEEFDFEIIYKKGKLNSNADALSRPPNLNILSTDEENLEELPIFDFMDDFYKDLEEIIAEDTRSIIVEPPDLIDLELEDDDVTIHTSQENPLCGIPITDDPINLGKNQIKFLSVKMSPLTPKIKHLFQNSKQRIIVQVSENNAHQEMEYFIQEYIVPNQQYHCHFETEDLYFQLSNVLRKKFNTNIKFKRCNKVLEDVESIEDQLEKIKLAHEGKTNHRGITETLSRLNKKYYWPNMQLTVQKYINNCDICKVVKYDRKPLKLKYNITPTPHKPFEIIHIDTLKYESQNFLTIIDAFSKYAQVYPLENIQAIEIMKKLLHFFTHHSIPTLIVSDNGSEFNNALITDFFRLHKIDIHFCSPHHPASNGLLERFHSTFLEHINLLHNREEFRNDPLEVKVLYATIAYNNSIHSTTKHTPFEIINYDFQPTIEINLEQEIISNYVHSHKEKIKILYELINKRLVENKENIITKLNEKREDIPDIPENVFVRRNFRSKKQNKYKKERVLDVNPERKTLRPEIPKNKTGRKFEKLHIENIKRPSKPIKILDNQLIQTPSFQVHRGDTSHHTRTARFNR